MSVLELSVVVATYNRPRLLERLLLNLSAQTLAPDRFEVVLVDDGSLPPAWPRAVGLQLRLIRQANAGAAAARDRGARQAQGQVLVFVDDDMQLAPDFLARHLSLHPPGSRRVVLGRIRPDPGLGAMPLFERYNATRLEKMAERYASGAVPLRGNCLCSGNVSLRRADYLAAGGFDPTLQRSEDAELGLRLEKLGLDLQWSEEAYVLHGSDHRRWEGWLASTRRYGSFDLRIARLHPELAHADPWRYFFSLKPTIRPFLALAVAAPGPAGALASAARYGAEAAARRGLEQTALRATGLVYGMEYFRGIRQEAGSGREALASLGTYLAKAARARPGAGPPATWPRTGRPATATRPGTASRARGATPGPESWSPGSACSCAPATG
jgi:glycosyltransferase involved in cell wall biosynthesis